MHLGSKKLEHLFFPCILLGIIAYLLSDYCLFKTVDCKWQKKSTSFLFLVRDVHLTGMFVLTLM